MSLRILMDFDCSFTAFHWHLATSSMTFSLSKQPPPSPWTYSFRKESKKSRAVSSSTGPQLLETELSPSEVPQYSFFCSFPTTSPAHEKISTVKISKISKSNAKDVRDTLRSIFLHSAVLRVVDLLLLGKLPLPDHHADHDNEEDDQQRDTDQWAHCHPNDPHHSHGAGSGGQARYAANHSRHGVAQHGPDAGDAVCCYL